MEEKEEKRGPGRPAGVRRAVTWSCSAIVDGELVSELCSVKDQTPEADAGSFPQELAEKDFEKDHGVSPQIVLGPLYNKCGSNGGKPKKKRLHIDRENLASYNFSVENKNAIFGEWKGMVNVIDDHPDKYFFIPFSQVDTSGKKKNVPASGIINVADTIIINDDDDTDLIEA